MQSDITNPQAVIDADTFRVRRTIRIAAPIENVWRTITEPELISQWFGQVTLTGSGAGAVGTIGWPGERRVPIRVDNFDAQGFEVAYRWCNEEGPLAETADDPRSTVFTFTLEALTPSETQLTVVEAGFEHTGNPTGLMTDHRGGWDDELDKLVALLGDKS